MNNWEAIAKFADQHDRPQPSRIVMHGVQIFSTEVGADGSVHTVVDTVRTMSEARAVLGY